jgi:hypothetical protein
MPKNDKTFRLRLRVALRETTKTKTEPYGPHSSYGPMADIDGGNMSIHDIICIDPLYCLGGRVRGRPSAASAASNKDGLL